MIAVIALVSGVAMLGYFAVRLDNFERQAANEWEKQRLLNSSSRAQHAKAAVQIEHVEADVRWLKSELQKTRRSLARVRRGRRSWNETAHPRDAATGRFTSK